jgi:hypothetical protein
MKASEGKQAKANNKAKASKEGKRRQAKASEGKRMQAKASEGKRRQAMANEAMRSHGSTHWKLKEITPKL